MKLQEQTTIVPEDWILTLTFSVCATLIVVIDVRTTNDVEEGRGASTICLVFELGADLGGQRMKSRAQCGEHKLAPTALRDTTRATYEQGRSEFRGLV